MIEFNSKNNNKTQQGENKTLKANSGKDLNTKKKMLLKKIYIFENIYLNFCMGN